MCGGLSVFDWFCVLLCCVRVSVWLCVGGWLVACVFVIVSECMSSGVCVRVCVCACDRSRGRLPVVCMC